MRLNVQNSSNDGEVATAIGRVVRSGDIQLLHSMIDAGFDVNSTNTYGTTPLMVAASYGRLEIVRALLSSGADPNRMRNDKFTALALAAFFGHEEVVRLLITHGAKPSANTRFNTSPQMWARARTFQGVAKYLNDQRNEPELTQIQSTKVVGANSCDFVDRSVPSAGRTIHEIKRINTNKEPTHPNRVTLVDVSSDTTPSSSVTLHPRTRWRSFVFVPPLLVLILGLVSFRLHRSKPANQPTNQPHVTNVDSTKSNIFETPVISSSKEELKTSTDATLNLNHYKLSNWRPINRPNVSRREPDHRQSDIPAESDVSTTLQPKITPQPSEVSKPSAEARTVSPVKPPTQKPPTAMTPLLITPTNRTTKSKVIQWP